MNEDINIDNVVTNIKVMYLNYTDGNNFQYVCLGKKKDGHIVMFTVDMVRIK